MRKYVIYLKSVQLQEQNLQITVQTYVIRIQGEKN